MARLLRMCLDERERHKHVYITCVCVYNDEGYILYTYTRSRNNLIDIKANIIVEEK